MNYNLQGPELSFPGLNKGCLKSKFTSTKWMPWKTFASFQSWVILLLSPSKLLICIPNAILRHTHRTSKTKFWCYCLSVCPFVTVLIQVLVIPQVNYSISVFCLPFLNLCSIWLPELSVWNLNLTKWFTQVNDHPLHTCVWLLHASQWIL